MTDKTKEEWTQRLLRIVGHLPVAKAFEIAEFIDDVVDEERKKASVLFGEWAMDLYHKFEGGKYGPKKYSAMPEDKQLMMSDMYDRFIDQGGLQSII